MLCGARSSQISIIDRRGNGDGAIATRVHVAKVIRKQLNIISTEPILIPKNVIMRRAACTLRKNNR